MKAIISVEQIEKRILFLRGHKVMLSSDLAALYGVSTKRLNEQVRRNSKRFPSDFMFQLDYQELIILRSHFATSRLWGGRRHIPLAFTEQGIAMLSSVLNSERAVQVNIGIMRAFVKLREILASHKELARKLEELEKTYDSRFRVVFDAIRQLMEPPVKPRPKIGFDLGGSRGSAAVEFVAAAPLVALFLLLIVQCAALFTQSIHDVAAAEAKASAAVAQWDAAQEGRGLHRPCLEEMAVHSVAAGGAPMAIGAGTWRRTIGVPQEVHLVEGAVCDR